MNNIPTIEELHRIGCAECKTLADRLLTEGKRVYLTAIRDAVVAACRPQLRPIAEMPAEVPEGCVRLYGGVYGHKWMADQMKFDEDTHYIDIALPSPTYPADFEQAFAESKLDAKDKAAAFDLWKKGGAR